MQFFLSNLSQVGFIQYYPFANEMLEDSSIFFDQKSTLIGSPFEDFFLCILKNYLEVILIRIFKLRKLYILLPGVCLTIYTIGSVEIKCIV